MMEQETEKREAVLGEVLSVAGMEPQALSIRVEKLIQIKTDKIQDLQFEVIKIAKKYNELLKYFHQKMDSLGIGLSGEEMEFQPIKVPDYKLATHSSLKYFSLFLTEEARAVIRNKDREVEEAQEMAEIDIKHVTQQIKHLQYEHQTRLGEMKAEYMTQLKMAQEDHGKQEQELLKDKRELRRLLREKEEMIFVSE
uniref:Uncharacterized protein n=1 Tax=Phlebotomus papatasi TaxID=29031 RepID=A0A1B0DA43_PHLPP